MKGKPKQQGQMGFMSPHLTNLCDPKHPLFILADQIPWEIFEKEFKSLYSTQGCPAKPIRLMVGLLILKQLNNLSEEKVVQKWVENPYYQYFCGEAEFQWEFPCDPSDIHYFRKRIGPKGVEKILAVSIALHGKKAKTKEVLVDTTVQEKNITYPTDFKLQVKIIRKCVKMAEEGNVSLRRSYKRTVVKLIKDQRFKKSKKQALKARKAARKVKTIAGRLVREMWRILPDDLIENKKEELNLFQKVLDQKREDKNKTYSLHEQDVYCITKGKIHKKFEFGNLVSIATTKDTNIIVGALSFGKNIFDAHTLVPVIKQIEELNTRSPKVVICDRGYRGKKKVRDTKILIPSIPKKNATDYEKRQARKRFRRRAAIEPIIGHLKRNYGLNRNFLSGKEGDAINVMLAAAAFNFNKLLKEFLHFFEGSILGFLKNILAQKQMMMITIR